MQRDHGAALFGLVVLLNQRGTVLGKNFSVDCHAAAVSEVPEAGLVLRIAFYLDGQVAIAALQPGGVSALDYRVKDLFEGRGYLDTSRRHHKTVQVWIIRILLRFDDFSGVCADCGQRHQLRARVHRDGQRDRVARRGGSGRCDDRPAGDGRVDHNVTQRPRVRDFQAVLSIILHRGRHRVCRSVFFRDRDDHLMRRRVIDHVGNAAIHFGDRVLPGPGPVIRDFAEACRRICFCRRRLCGRRHRRVFRHRRQREGEAVAVPPGIEALCHLKRRRRGRKGVRDRQTVLSVVLHFRRRRRRRVGLRHRDKDGMGCGVIAHAVEAAIRLGDHVLPGSRPVIRDLLKDRRGCVFCRRRRVFRRHRRAIHRRQREGEAVAV